MPRTAEVQINTSGGNLLYVDTQHQLTPTDSGVQRQDDQTTDQNITDGQGDVTSPPFIQLNEEIPTAALGHETADDGSNLVVNPQLPASQSPSVELPLFYPPRTVEQPKYQSATHYGPPRKTYNPHPGRQYNKDSPFKLLTSPSFKPSMLGFPPISNTRENVGLQINWGAKIGRAHSSFYDFLLA